MPLSSSRSRKMKTKCHRRQNISFPTVHTDDNSHHGDFEWLLFVFHHVRNSAKCLSFHGNWLLRLICTLESKKFLKPITLANESVCCARIIFTGSVVSTKSPRVYARLTNRWICSCIGNRRVMVNETKESMPPYSILHEFQFNSFTAIDIVIATGHLLQCCACALVPLLSNCADNR